MSTRSTCVAVPKHPAPTVSMGDCMGRIVNDHGVRGLFVGEWNALYLV